MVCLENVLALYRSYIPDDMLKQSCEDLVTQQLEVLEAEQVAESQSAPSLSNSLKDSSLKEVDLLQCPLSSPMLAHAASFRCLEMAL